MADITESSSSDGSPASIVPSGDVTLDKDVDNKTLKQNLYDLKLRIYYMEQKNKYKEEDDGEGDIYQKYVDLQTELEKLKKHLDEKDELLLKAQKVTMYLREEKEKTLYEFQEKEKVYKENIQQLEKEVEEMKLRDPKFGLHTSALVMPGGDSVDCDSSSLYVSNVSKMQRNKIGELESQLNQLNMELESVKANNDQLEQTVFNLQRKINLSNKEITELNKELSTLHKERDLYADNCSKRDEILDKMEKQKLEISEKLSKVEQENESLRSALTCNAEENGSSKSNDKGTAVIIQRLLIENKKVNGRLRKVKEDLLQFYEQCSACPHCVNEKKLKKAPILKLQPAAGVADTEANSAASVASTSEDERYDKGSVGGGVASAESDNDGERDKYTDLGENEIKTLLRDKDELIARLKGELKKRTFNLQELVNKELWDKNREIEKLNKMSEKRKKENDLLRKQLTTTTTSGSGSGGVVCGDNRTSMIMGGSSSCGYGYSYGYAKQPCSPRNYKMLEEEKENISCMSDDVKLLKEHLRGCLEEKKALLDKINTLESRVAVGDQERRSQNSLVRNLRLECAKRNDDFEEAEKARKEAFNACALLTNRLEELACFLESLLAHDGDDDGGGFGINANKRQLLKQAIEKSREISKSFSCTFGYATLPANATKLQNSSVDLSVPILPDCSEINLSFSGGDDDDDEDEDENRDENDHDHRCIVVADCCGNDRRRRCRSRRIGGDSEDKSTDVFAASTEDSDAYDRAAGAISFVRSLNPNNELVFSKTGVRKLTNNHVTINCASTCVNNGDDGDGGEMQNSVTASSAIVSLDEAPAKVGDFDSESETWSEPDRNVSAARIGLTNSASKVHATAKRLRSAAAERRFNTDSDASSHTSAAKKYPDAVDIKRLQKRIQHLENVNESLRKELQYSRLSPPSCLLDASVTADKKTDMEKLSEKTKLRNLLNKINLENCVDTNKYRDTVEGVRKHLRELCKHLAKTNELDKFVSLKLKEVCEHFELCELCCSRLNQQLEEAKTRNDVLAELLEETQSKFEQVMIELRATKLAYNSVILEHEQNIFKYKQCELTNEQLKQKLKSADELCRRLEEEQQQQQQQQQQRRRQRQNGNELTDSAGDADLLVDMLEKASKRIAQLELLVTCNDTTDEELRLCKRNVQELGEANERLLRDVQQLDAYKATIEEYRAQLAEYRENCEKLERELFEKERVEKLCRERCSELEAQLLEKDTLDRSLKLASQELREARSKMQRLEQRVDELAGELDETKENARLEHDRHAAELSGEKERNALLVRELRDNAQRELAEKSEAVAQLQQLVDVYDQRSRKFESEVQVLGGMLKACEEEKREFRAKIAQQMDEHENVKKEHEQKMKHLLSQIIAYRTEEEFSLAAHRELVQQIEQAQNRKHTWKKTIREWQQKYEELKKEKRDVEERLLRFDSNDDGQSSGMAVTVCGSSSSTSADYKLMKFNVERDWLAREAELRYQVDVATLTTSHVILEWTRLANEKLRLQRELHRRDKPLHVHHLENIKCQLEKRVKELETANRELELRLKRLQNMKIMPSGDFEASSETETEADDGDESSRPTSCKNDGLATFYSSYSLPTSPNNGNKRAFATLLASSVPNSPTCSRKDAFVGTTTTSTTTTATTTTIGDDDHCDSVQHPHCIKFMPARRHQSENTATSPDLGIDSDHGRNSSSFEFDSGNGGETNIRCEIINLEEENKSLKRELGQTKKELEETLDKLTALNKNKKRMEKAIFKQIFETKHILKRARVNLEDVEATATATAAAPMSDDNVDANAAV